MLRVIVSVIFGAGRKIWATILLQVDQRSQ